MVATRDEDLSGRGIHDPHLLSLADPRKSSRTQTCLGRLQPHPSAVYFHLVTERSPSHPVARITGEKVPDCLGPTCIRRNQPMRILIDVVHPAHVHFFRHLRTDLIGDGHPVRVISREKDVTTALLDRYEIPHRCVGSATGGGILSHGMELVRRVAALRREIKSFDADIVLTRNPSGVQAARISGVTGVFDTDDGSAVGIHFHAAKPFAHFITSPQCLREDYGRRHRRYSSFKAMAYLHPDRFRPDPAIREEVGVGEEEPLFLLRFSSHTASHDTSIEGLPMEAKVQLIRTLSASGKVIVSDEGSVPDRFREFRLSVGPDRFHDLLAAADLCIGDSQSVAAEAAILGTPAFRLSSFSGRVDYLRILEEDYALVRNFRPGEESLLIDEVRTAVKGLGDLKARAVEAHRRMLSECVDVTAWYRDLIYDIMDWDGGTSDP